MALWQPTHPVLGPLQALVACLDVDKSGTIDYSEFLAAMADGPTSQEDLLEVFKRFDPSGKGIITIKELQEVRASWPEHCRRHCA